MAKAKRLRSEATARKAAPMAWGGPGANGAPLAKARERAQATVGRAPLARTELLDKETRARVETELDAAVRRRPTQEAKLAGAIRALAPLSPALRASLGEATSLLLDRGALQRELYVCGLRALAEAQDRQAVPLLRRALAADEAGGAAALSASCFSHDPELSGALAKVAASRQSHLAFGAELARVARGESNGALLAQLAPMIKESHRIAMCVELFVPLLRAHPVSPRVGPALAVLRGAERHLGRWLLLADVAVKAGDLTPLEDAGARANGGPVSSRAAWSLVTWALRQTDAATRSAPPPSPPTARPTVELIARLSDRPSADRDPTFLFRMAREGSAAARPMLETLARTQPLADEAAIRAALYLARDGARPELRAALVDAALGAKREELRGLAAAALWEACEDDETAAGMRARALDIAGDLLTSKVIGNVAWGALIRAAAKRASGVESILREAPFRWIQWGWLE